MSIIQFLRIFWARRWLIVAATVSCLIGGLIVVAVLPPRWEAHTRVMLSLLKPDPVTGQSVGGQEGRVYASTQIELITDNSVADRVIDQLGWLSDPVLIKAYAKRSKSDQRDFRSWLAQLVIDSTKARLIQDSNILEISYTGTSADNAKAVADALRKAYIDTSLSFRRQDAERNAEWFEQQSVKAKAGLDTAIAAQSAFERDNGIVMANDKLDEESARLQALTTTASGVAGAPPVMPPMNSAAAMELAQLDAQLTAEGRVLGPNNPEMQALRAKRGALASVAAQEKAAARAAYGGAAAGMGAFDRAVAAQKSKVIADSAKISRLTEMQNDINLRRDELTKLLAKVAQYREEAVVGDAGITPLGAASTPKAPSFPNYPLVIIGAVGLGGGVGVMMALLMELLARRVRGMEDLSAFEDLPLIGVVTAPPRSRRRLLRVRLPKLAWPSRRREMVRA